MREEKEEAAVVISVLIHNNKEVKSLRNREGDDEARTFIRAERTFFAASFRSKSNDDSSALTGPRDNQPITLVLRVVRFM